MKKACYVIGPPFNNNRLFDSKDPVLNRDDCLRPYIILREKFRQAGFDLNTSDINDPRESDIVIYHNMPRKLPRSDLRNRAYLRLTEAPVIRPDNWDLAKHRYFRQVFTWHDGLVDDDRYIKANFPQVFPTQIAEPAHERSLCCLIARNKRSNHPKEMYSARIETIKWFERNHPDEFDLFGIGWDRFMFGGILSRLNRLTQLQKILAPERPSLRGPVKIKRDVLRNYRFSICYENASGFPGYITEKLFDCLFAGTIPVYYGAPNVEQHVPQSCFIDRREFPTHEELYSYLVTMGPKEYCSYLTAAKEFLRSQCSTPFRADYIAETIVKFTAI